MQVVQPILQVVWPISRYMQVASLLFKAFSVFLKLKKLKNPGNFAFRTKKVKKSSEKIEKSWEKIKHFAQKFNILFASFQKNYTFARSVRSVWSKNLTKNVTFARSWSRFISKKLILLVSSAPILRFVTLGQIYSSLRLISSIQVYVTFARSARSLMLRPIIFSLVA